MANNTNIQFYTDSRIVFETSNGNVKTAIGSAYDTVQGLEIEYNLGVTGENKAFKISPLGINYTFGPTGATGSINYTTPLDRIAQVDSLIQSLETPPDATTLQVDKRILLTDGVSSSSIEISGVNTQITASNDLILNPVGLINTNGSTIDMTNGQISNCSLLQGVNNTNIILEGKGTGDVILKTGATNRLTIDETGFFNFEGGMTYDNGSNTISAADFSGLVSNATNSVNAENLLVTTDDTSGNYYPTFVKTSGTDNKPFFIDTSSPMTYNPSTGVMAFPNPPITTVSATTTNQLVNFNNFTPTSYVPILIGTGLGTPTYVTQNGTFTKINNLCFCQISIEISAINDLSGNLTIPLPIAGINVTNGVNNQNAISFAIGNIGGLAAAGGLDLTASTTGLNSGVASAIRLDIRPFLASPASDQLTTNNITNNFKISLGGSYFVA